jgi:hypothetical protein
MGVVAAVGVGAAAAATGMKVKAWIQAWGQESWFVMPSNWILAPSWIPGMLLASTGQIKGSSKVRHTSKDFQDALGNLSSLKGPALVPSLRTIGLRCGVYRRVEKAIGNPPCGWVTPEMAIQPQDVERFGMMGPSDTLRSPWSPLAICPCLEPCVHVHI